MKNVTLDRSYGDILVRTDKKYKNTGIKNKNIISITVPDNEATIYNRVGGIYQVEDMLSTSDVFTNFSILKIDSTKLPNDMVNKDKATINQNKLTVEKVDNNTYNLKCDFSKLEKYENSATSGELKWLGLFINTGETSIVWVEINGKALTSEDATNTTKFGGTTGSIVYWTNVEKGQDIITLTNKGKSCVVILNMINVPSEV